MLDLGTFIIESDTQTASQLSTEAATLYECLSLDGRDIGAYVVEGPFHFDSAQKQISSSNEGGPATAQVKTRALLPLLC